MGSVLEQHPHGGSADPRWIALSDIQLRRLRELAAFYSRYAEDPSPVLRLVKFFTGKEDGSEPGGIVVTDETLLDLQQVVEGLSELNGVVVVELHLRIYSEILDELRAMRGYPPLALYAT